jgi:type IV secretion system protein VirD4
LPSPQNPTASVVLKADDWSVLKPVGVPSSARKSVVVSRPEGMMREPDRLDEDSANGGIRREPGLERHKDIAPEPLRSPVNEFDPDADEVQRDTAANRAQVREMRLMARQIALDPGDGMEL